MITSKPEIEVITDSGRRKPPNEATPDPERGRKAGGQEKVPISGLPSLANGLNSASHPFQIEVMQVPIHPAQ